MPYCFSGKYLQNSCIPENCKLFNLGEELIFLKWKTVLLKYIQPCLLLKRNSMF